MGIEKQQPNSNSYIFFKLEWVKLEKRVCKVKFKLSSITNFLPSYFRKYFPFNVL